MGTNALRSWRPYAAGLLLALVAGCGGGGGDSQLAGSWRLSTALGGVTMPDTIVTGADVLSESEAAAFTVEQAAQVEAGRFPGKTVSVSGDTVRATDPDTDFTVVVESVGLRSYEGCGTCAVGTTVTFDTTVVQRESGLLDGVPPPFAVYKSVLRMQYERIS